MRILRAETGVNHSLTVSAHQSQKANTTVQDAPEGIRHMETMATTIATAKLEASKPFNKRDLVAALAEQHHLSKRASQKMLDDLIGLITKHLKKGERVKITGLGILQVRKRAARMGRNPATGEAIKIKASKKVAFRATKGLKMAV
jgi:DNA-binding protein HU-beta